MDSSLSKIVSRPIFQELPDDATEDWIHGVIVGGIVSSDLLIARAFKRAGDVLIEQSLKNREPHEVAYPILHAYRHAVELYLKLIVAPANRSHDLDPLIAGLEAIVARDRSERLPSWVKNRLDEFAKLDPQSFSFRYAKGKENKDFIMPSEWWVELQALRKVMDVMCRGFERLIQEPA